MTGRGVEIVSVAEADALYVGTNELPLVAPTLYVPSGVPLGAVTWSVTEALAPGERVTELLLYAAAQPVGTDCPKTNVDELHAEVSLFINVTVKFAGTPGATELDGPTIDAAGLTCVQARVP